MYIFSINIVGFQISPTWYGLMYAIGFISGYFILQKRKIFTKEQLESLLLYIFFWVLIGGRIGYVFFYNLSYFLEYPSKIFSTWEWGMSFHGWVIGVIIAMYLFTRRHKIRFLLIADEVTSILPIGIGLGRIGNYINGELLWYSPYVWPFSVIQNWIPHFPSTLLEAILEWVVLFVILAFLHRYKSFHGQIASMFLFSYGIMRFFIEFFRLPDAHIWYLFWTNWITMWHILTLPMILIGGILYFYFQNRTKSESPIDASKGKHAQ